MKIVKVDHIAIAVKDITEALALYKDKLELEFEGREIIQGRNVEAAFLKCGELEIELVQPLMTGESAVGGFIKENGEGLYHLAFQVDDIEDAIKSLKEKQLQFKEPCPGKGAKNSRIAFLDTDCTKGVTMEFVEKIE